MYCLPIMFQFNVLEKSAIYFSSLFYHLVNWGYLSI